MSVQYSLVPLILAGATKKIFGLDLKGIIYGGYFRTQTVVNAAAVSIQCDIDSNTIGLVAYATLFAYGVTEPYRGLPYFTRYDPDGELFVFGFSPGISFGTKYNITIENASAGGMLIDGALFYSQII